MLHTARSIARQYHLDPRIVKAEIQSGRLPSVSIGARRKVHDAVLDAWLKGQLTPPNDIVELVPPPVGRG